MTLEALPRSDEVMTQVVSHTVQGCATIASRWIRGDQDAGVAARSYSCSWMSATAGRKLPSARM